MTPLSLTPEGKLSVKQLLRNTSAVSDLSLPVAFRYDEMPSNGDITGMLHFELKSTGFMVRGEIQADLQLECDRTTEPFHRTFIVPVEEEYAFKRFLEEGPRHANREVELSDDDYYEVIEENGELDVRDFVHQMLVLATAGPQYKDDSVVFAMTSSGEADGDDDLE